MSWLEWQVEDRSELIQAVLDSKPGIYQDQATLNSLAELLGVADKGSAMQLRSAYAALREGDEEFARQQCLNLVFLGVRDAWPLASQLSSLKATAMQHPQDTKKLLGFALAHCPKEQVIP